MREIYVCWIPVARSDSLLKTEKNIIVHDLISIRIQHVDTISNFSFALSQSGETGGLPGFHGELDQHIHQTHNREGAAYDGTQVGQ